MDVLTALLIATLMTAWFLLRVMAFRKVLFPDSARKKATGAKSRDVKI